ncbi:autotransporter-associated beta strand repeat-containing protein [Luteolibacter sp. LG18]|uniref:autotransporter-associated beta strand repeat-containing protein n=1 Tax=Luteolibacter sp. LG18 TaxID=2819286 RepID=UPI002B28D65A|nr:hypothetical protein llg_20410 [Luteolibacter sp. LG18]
MKTPRFSLFASVFALVISSPAHATDIVWNGSLGAGPSVWNLTTNWTGSVIPNSSTDRGDLRKDWTAAPTLNLTAATTVNGILFDDTGASGDVAMTLSNNSVAGNTLTLAGTTPSMDVTGSLSISGVLAGNTAWTKTGTGTLNLANVANTSTAGVSVTGGTLQLGSLTTTQTYAFAGTSLSLASGTTLSLGGSSGGTITHTYNFAGLGTNPISVTDATLSFTSTNATTKAFNAALAFTGTNTITYTASSFTHSLNLNKAITGSGTLNFNFSGGGTRSVNIATGLTNNFTGAVVLNTGAATTTFNLGSALGASSYEVRNGWNLVNGVAGGLNSASSISLVNSGSAITLNNPVVNAAATLTQAASTTVTVGTGASTVGTLTVNGAATVTGTTGSLAFTTANLNAGLSGTGTLAPAVSGTITNAAATATLTVANPIAFSTSGVSVAVSDVSADANADLIFSGTLSGTTGFAKTGAGTLRFAGSGNFGGQVAVNNGKIEFLSFSPTGVTGGFSGTGNIDVKGTSVVTLGGSSTGYTGTVTVADGASLGGEAVLGGPLVVGTLNGAKLWPDVSTPTAALTATDVTLNGLTPILFPTPPAPGTYTVLNYTGTLNGSAANLAANYRGASLDMGTGTNSAITLTIGLPVSLFWMDMAGNHTWDTGTSASWYHAGDADRFYTADVVVFNDYPGVMQDVVVATEGVAPGSMTVSNSSVDYSFNGGPISGVTGVTKDGNASVTFSTPNTYTGNTVLNGGSIRVGTTGALGAGTLSLATGALTTAGLSAVSISNPVSVDGNVTLGSPTYTGALTLSGNVALTASRTVTVESPVTLSGVVGGAFNLTKDGADTLTLTGTNTYGNTTVAGGTLQVGAGGAAGVLPAAASVNSGTTLRYFRSDTPTLANVFSGNGTLAFKGTGTSAQSSYSLTGANTITGTVAAENGARVQADNSAGTRYGTAVVQVQSGGQAYLSAGTFANDFNIVGNGWTEGSGQLGAIRVNATITGSVTLSGPARIAPYSGTGTISGALIGTDPLEIGASTSASFTGTLNYSGNGMGYTGLATVSQGTLNLTGTLGGSLAISSSTYAATLAGEGSVAGNLTLGNGSIGSNVTIDPATPGAFTAGSTLTVLNTATVGFTNIPAAGGTFTVLRHGGTTATPSNFAVAGSAGYRTAPVFDTTTDPTAVTVQVTPGSAITWKGNSSAVWDVNTTVNWLGAGAVAEKFYTLDSVTFDDTATVFAPTLAVAVSPASVTFNNSANAYTLTGAGSIGGTGGLVKSGTNSLTLSTANTFTGDVAINGGKLVMGNAAALGNATIKNVTVANGGQLDLAGFSPGTTRSFTYKIAGTGADGNGALTNSTTTSIAGNSGILNLELTADATVGGAGRFDIGGTAGTGIVTGNGHTLTKVGASQIQLRGDATGTPIAIVVQAGTLGAENVDTAFGGATGSVSVANGATVGTYGARTIATPVSLAAGATLTNLGTGTGTWTGPISVAGDATVNPAGQIINLNGVVSGAGGITVLPNGGTLNFAGANTFSGGLLIGTTNTTATTVNIATGSTFTVAAGKLVQLGNNSGTGSFSNQTLTVSGAVTSAGTLFMGRAGTVTLNSGATWDQSGDVAANAQGGYPGTLNVNTGSTFTYTGSTTVKVNGGSTGIGTISIGGLFVTSMGFEQNLTPSGSGYGVVTLAGGTVRLTADVPQLTTSNRFTLGSGGGTIDTNGHNASLSYAISGAGNALTKAGVGRLTLTGACTYSGATTVTGGTLAGTGSASSAVTVNSGTHLAPGTTTGTFNCAGAVLASGSTLDIEISSSGGTADKVVSTGDVTITGANATFTEIGTGALAGGTKLVILDYTGKTLTGTFNGLAEGATVTVGANSFTLSYTDASRITLTAAAGAGYSGWASTNAGGQAANLDFDGDGVKNGVEYLMGATGSSQTANPGVVNGKIIWPKEPSAAVTWAVETSPDLSVWTAATSGVTDLGTSIEYVVPTGAAKRFVRLRVTAP